MFIAGDAKATFGDSQNVGSGPQRYRFTERLIAGDSKATFNKVVVDIGHVMIITSTKL